MEVNGEEWQRLEEQVERVLNGQGLEVSGCDVGLDQSKPATLKKNVTYIVCAVIFNEKVRPRTLSTFRKKKFDCCYILYVYVWMEPGGGADGAGGKARLLQTVVPSCRAGGGGGESGGCTEEGGKTPGGIHLSVFFLTTKPKQ